MTVGRVSSICVERSRSAARSCPPRLRIAASSASSSRSAIRPAMLGAGRRRRAAARAAPSAAQRKQALIFGVGHVDDAGAQRGAARAREQLLEQPAELDGDDLPARCGEHRLQAAGGDVGHHPVQRLPVEVDDPDDLTEVGDRGIEDRLPHRAFVQFGVTDQRVLAAGAARRRAWSRRSGARSRPRSARSHRCRPSRSSSRPGRGPWIGSDSSAGRRIPAAVVRYYSSSSPSR